MTGFLLLKDFGNRNSRNINILWLAFSVQRLDIYLQPHRFGLICFVSSGAFMHCLVFWKPFCIFGYSWICWRLVYSQTCLHYNTSTAISQFLFMTWGEKKIDRKMWIDTLWNSFVFCIWRDNIWITYTLFLPLWNWVILVRFVDQLW